MSVMRHTRPWPEWLDSNFKLNDNNALVSPGAFGGRGWTRDAQTGRAVLGEDLSETGTRRKAPRTHESLTRSPAGLDKEQSFGHSLPCSNGHGRGVKNPTCGERSGLDEEIGWL